MQRASSALSAIVICLPQYGASSASWDSSTHAARKIRGCFAVADDGPICAATVSAGSENDRSETVQDANSAPASAQKSDGLESDMSFSAAS